MNLDEVKAKIDNFNTINNYGFIESMNTKYFEKDLEITSRKIFTILNDYTLDKYGKKLFNIRNKKNIIELELEDFTIKHLRK